MAKKYPDFTIGVREAERALGLEKHSIHSGNMARRIGLNGELSVSAVGLANELKSKRRPAASIYRTLDLWHLAQQ